VQFAAHGGKGLDRVPREKKEKERKKRIVALVKKEKMGDLQSEAQEIGV